MLSPRKKHEVLLKGQKDRDSADDRAGTLKPCVGACRPKLALKQPSLLTWYIEGGPGRTAEKKQPAKTLRNGALTATPSGNKSQLRQWSNPTLTTCGRLNPF